MRVFVPLLLLAFGALRLFGQDAAPVTRDDLPPSAILSDELTSFDRVHSDMANWSDVELAAFQNTRTQAKADCGRIEQTPHEGEEALALAQLCALGWEWDGTYSAARWYTRRSAPAAETTHLAAGFAMLLKADLNLRAVPRALEELKEMQERVPFSDDTDSIYAYTISALEVMMPEDGVKAAMLRQASLLDAVAGKNAAVSAGRTEAEAWHVLAMLHAMAMGDAEQEQKTLLLQAIAARTQPLPAAEQYAAQRSRARYEWLGKKAPQIAAARNSYPVSAHHAAGAAIATLLVVEDARAADVAALSLGMDLVRTHLEPKTQATLVLTGSPSTSPEKRDAHAPVIHALFTSAPLLETFAAEAGPLFVLVDGSGVVQWLGSGTAAWLSPQQQAETLLSRVAAAH